MLCYIFCSVFTCPRGCCHYNTECRARRNGCTYVVEAIQARCDCSWGDLSHQCGLFDLPRLTRVLPWNSWSHILSAKHSKLSEYHNSYTNIVKVGCSTLLLVWCVHIIITYLEGSFHEINVSGHDGPQMVLDGTEMKAFFHHLIGCIKGISNSYIWWHPSDFAETTVLFVLPSVLT